MRIGGIHVRRVDIGYSDILVIVIISPKIYTRSVITISNIYCICKQVLDQISSSNYETNRIRITSLVKINTQTIDKQLLFGDRISDTVLHRE